MEGSSYSRQALKKEYPGFGEDYVLFPGESGEDVYGYLRILNQSRLLGIGESNEKDEMFFVYYNR